MLSCLNECYKFCTCILYSHLILDVDAPINVHECMHAHTHNMNFNHEILSIYFYRKVEA